MSTWKANQLNGDYRQMIDRAVQYINENLSGEISLTQAARVASLSAFHFHRIFSVMVGETLNAYVNRVRLERAANYLIKSTAFSITEIAFACGFSSSAAFARSFRQHFGIPPSQFRALKSEQYRQQIMERKAPKDVVPPLLETILADVLVKEMPRFHVAYVSNLEGYSLVKICAAWEKLFRWAQANGVIGGNTVMIGLSLDDPFITPTSRCRYYACVSVPEDIHLRAKLPGAIGIMDIHEGRYATCKVSCFPDEIGQVYRTLYGRWLPESGFFLADEPAYEIYYQTPVDNAEGKYVLEVCLPVT